MAEDLKTVTMPDFVLIAESGKQAIGYAVAILDINRILKMLKKGRLFPFGFTRLMNLKRKIKYLKIINLGVIPEYRQRGIEAVFYHRIFEAARAGGIVSAEASYVMNNNIPMRRGIERIGGKITKHYRIYRKKL
jgi:hypothetical protein